MRKKYYLTLDTETATLPFIGEVCHNAADRKKIAIAKPLVYDIGWTVTDRQGNTIRTENYLVQETFFVPNIFNTAYYKDKRPIYMELLARDEIKVDCWNNIIEKLIYDLDSTDLATAYNACFDFKKAIPFTERYIKHLYSADYTEWELAQREKCKEILAGKDDSKNEEYLEPIFNLRGNNYNIADLWGIACDRLINVDKYKDYCLKNKLLTTSATYFKTSAETSFQYLMKDYDFIENHTALSDAEIEAQILTKALKKGKVEPTITAFPFRELGTTFDYAIAKKKYLDVVAEMLETYIEDNDGEFKASDGSIYWKKILDNLFKIYEVMENE